MTDAQKLAAINAILANRNLMPYECLRRIQEVMKL